MRQHLHLVQLHSQETRSNHGTPKTCMLDNHFRQSSCRDSVFSSLTVDGTTQSRGPWAHHVGACGPGLRVVLAVCQHHNVCFSEAQPGREQVFHAVGIIDAALQLVGAPPAPSHPCMSASPAEAHGPDENSKEELGVWGSVISQVRKRCALIFWVNPHAGRLPD